MTHRVTTGLQNDEALTQNVADVLLIRDAVVGGDGNLDSFLYGDTTRDLSTTVNNQSYLAADIKQRFKNSTASTGLSLNALFAKNQYGVAGVGGGDFSTGLAIGGYSEGRGNSAITGSMYGAELASTMYNSGSITNAFGALTSGQLGDGSTASITNAYGVQAYARALGSASGNITQAIGVNGIAGTQDTASGTITTAIGGQFSTIKSTGAITNAYGINIPSITQGSTANYGIRIAGASGGATTNNAIQVDSGTSKFANGIVSMTNTSNGINTVMRLDANPSSGSADDAAAIDARFVNGSGSGIIGGKMYWDPRVITAGSEQTDFVVQEYEGGGLTTAIQDGNAHGAFSIRRKLDIKTQISRASAQNQFVLNVPVGTADPANPNNGDIWLKVDNFAAPTKLTIGAFVNSTTLYINP